MNRGLYLSIRMGSLFNPSPVSQAVIEAITEIQVTNSVGSQSGFQMKFTLGKQSPFNNLLQSGYFDPRTRVIIIATVHGTPQVLMDGIITKQDVTPSNQPGQSTLTVTGLDLSAIMDFIDLTDIPYPAMPLFTIVALILAKYAVFGVAPLVIPTSIIAIQNPLERFRKQQGTDFNYINALGQASGHIFYLEPGPEPGMSIAYWGPEYSKFTTPQPALSINMDADDNVESLSFSYDGLAARQYLAIILEQNSRIPIPVPIPEISILKSPLAQQTPPNLKSARLEDIARNGLGEAALKILGALMATPDAISSSGQLDVLRYGRILKARQLVSVRGGSNYYDGLYQVKSVTHNIKRGEYKQSFSLVRGGVKSSIERVSV
ncbi:hypothetical protein DSM106972_059490 [Dulcicalothrix desertica PCC 7102]|uniref:Uncharacterized protein n=1 Tax=Dulcicalothrix desertica PCC 7102 TaxID=232991 RepID=A0A3S1CJ17_9CYAN|nr:hypothetical protein [Dulcicalothrix desertica]RUT02471.1 hypothetical protein DSM106972_059490 [Dulcicalothrix desertica PCC 7102]TWH55312.1 hypothetical protein CAL7102_03436 [Dulcicalothrix desertica PCC 7102]